MLIWNQQRRVNIVQDIKKTCELVHLASWVSVIAVMKLFSQQNVYWVINSLATETYPLYSTALGISNEHEVRHACPKNEIEMAARTIDHHSEEEDHCSVLVDQYVQR